MVFEELTGPERDAFRVQCARNVDGPAQEVGTDGPAGGVGVHQGRVVLETRIEQVPCTRLDDPAHSPSVQARAHRADLASENSGIFVGIERPHVERDRHALVPLVGQQVDSVGQAMMSQAVGVISQSHGEARQRIMSSKASGPAETRESRALRWLPAAWGPRTAATSPTSIQISARIPVFTAF